MVPDPATGEDRQDRREGDLARPLSDLPDGRGGGAERAVPGHPQSDRRVTPRRRCPMLTPSGRRLPVSPGRRASAPCLMTDAAEVQAPWRTASATFLLEI